MFGTFSQLGCFIVIEKTSKVRYIMTNVKILNLEVDYVEL